MDGCRCCDIDGCRTSPPRFGAGVLMNMPGVGRCGVVGTAKFILSSEMRRTGAVALVRASFRRWLVRRAGRQASTLIACKC